MKVEHCKGPSYGDLRPILPDTSPTFPVDPCLVGRLVAARHYPDADSFVAFVMAVCSGYAYGDAATVAMIMTRLGLERNNCLMVSEYVDALLLTSTAFLIQSEDGRVVILCYRGTPPTSVITWLTDFNINPVRINLPGPKGSDEYEVHGGFYRNVRSTRYAIEDALKLAMAGRSVLPCGNPIMPGPMEALYITGHSLGGASAALLAAMLVTEPDFEPIAGKLRKGAVYTFGAPMIGSKAFAAACNEDQFLREKLIRYVYENDIVPQVPPTASGDFAHFGVEYQYKSCCGHGKWSKNHKPRKQLHNLVGIITTPLSFLAKQTKLTRNLPFPASINDHLPQYYIDALTPERVRSEFGD